MYEYTSHYNVGPKRFERGCLMASRTLQFKSNIVTRFVSRVGLIGSKGKDAYLALSNLLGLPAAVPSRGLNVKINDENVRAWRTYILREGDKVVFTLSDAAPAAVSSGASTDFEYGPNETPQPGLVGSTIGTAFETLRFQLNMPEDMPEVKVNGRATDSLYTIAAGDKVVWIQRAGEKG